MSTNRLLENGSLRLTEAGGTRLLEGVSALSGVLDITEAGDTIAATGTLAIAGAAAITEADDTLASTGTLGAVPVSGGGRRLAVFPHRRLSKIRRREVAEVRAALEADPRRARKFRAIVAEVVADTPNHQPEVLAAMVDSRPAIRALLPADAIVRQQIILNALRAMQAEADDEEAIMAMAA
jgi:hypothetical protein